MTLKNIDSDIQLTNIFDMFMFLKTLGMAIGTVSDPAIMDI